MPATLALVLLLSAPAAPNERALADSVAEQAPRAPEAGRYAVAAGTTAAGGGIGALLAITAGLPLLFAAEAGVGDAGAAGAGLILFLAVPIGAGLGAAAMCAGYADGIGPWLTGVTVGLATLIAFAIAAGAIAEQVPQTPEQQLGVTMVYVAPVITAAVVGALVGMLAVPPIPDESTE